MGKITVKHYLNKKVAPITNDVGSLLYPIYLKIIYNKFSTDKRSGSTYLMSDKGFEYYTQNNKILASETKEQIKLSSIFYPLENELIDAECSIKIIDNRNIKVKRQNIIDVIKEFSKPVYDYFIEQYRNGLFVYCEMGKPDEENYNTDYENFILSFSKNIPDSIRTIEAYTNLNLGQFIKEETKIQFRILDVIKKISDTYTTKQNRKVSFSEFVCSDYKAMFKAELKLESVEYFDKIITELNDMIDEYIENGTILYV